MADNTLFTRITTHDYTVILIYVDDLVVAGNNITTIQAVKDYLHAKFSIKDLGELKFFLGLELARSPKGISLNQQKYCLELLSDTALLACKAAKTPMDSTIRLSKKMRKPLEDKLLYRRLIGRLIYLTSTRVDIYYSVQQLSQFMDSPTETHYQAATRVIRYLKNEPGKGLFFPATSDFLLHAFSDSD
jgi:hypothetical protein